MDEGAQARSHSEEAAALLLSSIFGSNSGGEENVLSCDLLQKPRYNNCFDAVCGVWIMNYFYGCGIGGPNLRRLVRIGIAL